MIVSCPACSSKYSVQADAIGNGKLVRCAMCCTTWQQIPIDESIDKRKRAMNLINWTFFWFVTFVSIFSLFFAKEAVIKIWPPAVGFYEALDIGTINTKKSFTIQNISNFFMQKNGKLYMGLRGEITNISDEVQQIPGLTISLKDDNLSVDKSGKSPYKKIWTHDLMYKKLLPNQKVVFETELQSVPYNNLICDIKLDAL